MSDRSISLPLSSDTPKDVKLPKPQPPPSDTSEISILPLISRDSITTNVHDALNGLLQFGCNGLQWECGVVWGIDHALLDDFDESGNDSGGEDVYEQPVTILGADTNFRRFAHYQHVELKNYNAPKHPLTPHLLAKAFIEGKIFYGNLHRDSRFQQKCPFLRLLMVPLNIPRTLTFNHSDVPCVAVFFSAKPEIMRQHSEVFLELHGRGIHKATETIAETWAVQVGKKLQETCNLMFCGRPKEEEKKKKRRFKLTTWPNPMTIRSYFEKYGGYPEYSFNIRKYSLSELLWTFIGAMVGMLAISVPHYLYFSGTDFVFLIGSHGAMAVLSFGFVESPLGQPRNALLGHAVSALVGVFVIMLVDVGMPLWLGAAMCVALSICFMQFLGCLHPPGAATAIIYVMSKDIQQLGFWYVLIPVETGVAIMTIVAILVNNLSRERHYPIQWWSPHKDQDSSAVAVVPQVYWKQYDKDLPDLSRVSNMSPSNSNLSDIYFEGGRRSSNSVRTVSDFEGKESLEGHVVSVINE